MQNHIKKRKKQSLTKEGRGAEETGGWSGVVGLVGGVRYNHKYKYSGTSLKGLSELRTQYKKPPY